MKLPLLPKTPTLLTMRTIVRVVVMLVIGLLWATGPLLAADNIAWRGADNSVDADINNWPLQQVLSRLAKSTGWQVYVEPGASATISAKFKKLPSDEALHRLLGNTSFSLTHSNGVARLFVYQTEARAATQLVAAENKSDPKDYLIGNELIVKLKKGSKMTIEELAKLTGGKIVARDDALGIYRLQFADEKAMASAAKTLEGNDNVAWVDSNYLVDPPTPRQLSPGAAAANQFSLNPKQTSECSPIIGLIDTAIQPMPGFEQYLMPAVSVVGNVTATGNVPTHGTGMFQTMMRSMANSPAKVLPVVIYRGDPNAVNGTSEATTTFEVAQGIVKAVNSGANPINLSLGGTGDSEFLRQLIADASAKGIVFVAAAGNEPTTNPTFPAAWPGVVAVTAAGPDGKIASYANSGNFVKAMAPGESIVSVGGQAWDMQGTSVATAYVTGALAGKSTADCLPPAKLTDQVVATLPVKR